MKASLSRDNEQETATRRGAPDFTVRPLPLGHRLGELQLDEVLGIGGFGIVYRAFDRTLRRAVAIKEYMPSMLATRGGDYTVSLRAERFAQAFDAGRGAFLNEARLLAQFDHPGLVKVLHFWESHGTAYMVMPFHEGRTLKQLLDGGSHMGEPQLRNVVAALLGALDTLHRAQCFHRDVALDNVLICPDGGAVLLDFGAARKRIGDLVDDGAMMIKPGYAPIEQYTDDPAFSQGPWTDLYALGAVMHAMITGELPPAAVVRSIKDTYQPLASRELPGREPYSPTFLAAVDHALQLRIADRPDSVAAFAAELGLRDLGRAGYAAVAPSPDEARAKRAEHAQGEEAPPVSPEPQSSPREAPAMQSVPTQRATDDAGAPEADATNFVGPPPPADDDSTLPGALIPPASASAPVTEARMPQPPFDRLRDALRDRRMRAYIGGALALLLATGIGLTYLAKPARHAGEMAGASEPQANGASSPVIAQGAASLAQSSPAPAVAPPSSGASAQLAPPVVATAPASGNAAAPAPQVAANGRDAAPPQPVTGSAVAPAASLDASERVVNMPPSEAAAALPAPASGAEAMASSDSAPAATSDGQPPQDAMDTVAVRFHVRPWGDIYVSGVRRGASPPLRSVSLAPGTYQIEIRNGSLPPLRRTVKIDPGSKPISIDYAFE
ncbi:serine/threonine protein kinase [Caballeronia calidae]|uniref:non-specific serine/threonine protein kinase n=1 Tax=Caballeronia calidae TaxID=1777139 RepID=A0A158CL74_9BURK|nr:serine/threonine-protein kinase [Caballeronia calidae]SAK83041.1 serine/threonine protein kinase [Caballeronia calidae]